MRMTCEQEYHVHCSIILCFFAFLARCAACPVVSICLLIQFTLVDLSQRFIFACSIAKLERFLSLSVGVSAFQNETSYRSGALLVLQDSSTLSDFIVSFCNQRIAIVLWTALPSCFSEHNFNTLGKRVVLSLFLMVTLRTLRRCTRVLS